MTLLALFAMPTFVTPWLAAAGAAAMAIPILIHLIMRRRRQPIPWAAMRLLRKALRDRARRLRLEQWLVLALRCLLLAALGAALAQPLLHQGASGDRRGSRVVYMVLDDSMTADLRSSGQGTPSSDGDASAFARSIEQAEAILAGLAPGDAVAVIAAGRPVRGLVLPPTTDHTAVRALLRSIAPVHSPADVPAALAMLRESIDRLDEGRAVAAYLLSEFRVGSVPLDVPLSPLLSGLRQRDVVLLAAPPAEETPTNTQIVSVEPLRSLLLPGQSDGSGQITVRLARHGDLVEGISRVSLSGVDVKPIAARAVRWEAGQSQAAVEFSIEPATREHPALGLVARLDPDRLPADDERTVVVASKPTVRVLLLERRGFGDDALIERLTASQWLSRALRPTDASPLEVTSEDPTRLEPRPLRAADAVIVARPDLLEESSWTALREVLGRGGLVVIAPPEELNVHLWVDRMVETFELPWKIGIEAIETPEGETLSEQQPATPLLHLLAGELGDLVRPVRLFRRLPIEPSSAAGQAILVAADGAPVVVAAAVRGAAPKAHDAGATRPASSPILNAPTSAPPPSSRGLAGQLVLFSFAPVLGWTDLPTKPLMVPLIQEIVRQGVGLGAQTHAGLVGEVPILPPSVAELAPLVEGVPRVVLRDALSPPILHAGLYQERDAAELPLGLISINIDPAAGDTRAQEPEAVAAWLRGSAPERAWSFFETATPLEPLRGAEGGTSIAFALLLVALGCALLESLLSRLFSHSTIKLQSSVGAAI